MKGKYNLYDIMQNYEMREELYIDKAEKKDIERLKRLVFKKKGNSYMKFKVLRRVAVVLVTVLLVSGSVVGINAASGGAIKDGISKVIHIKIRNGDGFVEEKDMKAKENKDGSHSIDIPCDKDATIHIEENGTEKEKIEFDRNEEFENKINLNGEYKEDKNGDSEIHIKIKD